MSKRKPCYLAGPPGLGSSKRKPRNLSKSWRHFWRLSIHRALLQTEGTSESLVPNETRCHKCKEERECPSPSFPCESNDRYHKIEVEQKELLKPLELLTSVSSIPSWGLKAWICLSITGTEKWEPINRKGKADCTEVWIHFAKSRECLRQSQRLLPASSRECHSAKLSCQSFLPLDARPAQSSGSPQNLPEMDLEKFHRRTPGKYQVSLSRGIPVHINAY